MTPPSRRARRPKPVREVAWAVINYPRGNAYVAVSPKDAHLKIYLTEGHARASIDYPGAPVGQIVRRVSIRELRAPRRTRAKATTKAKGR